MDILTDWAFKVQGWSNWGDGLWLTQRNFEQLHSSHHDSAVFLAGLEHLLDLIEQPLLTDEGAAELFGHVKDVDMLTRIWRAQNGQQVELENDSSVDIIKARASTLAGARKFRKWIAERRLPPHKQALEAFRTIHFEETETDRHGFATRLSVPLLSDADEHWYPAMLLRRFELTQTPHEELRPLLRQLRELMHLPLQRVIDHEQEHKEGKFYLSHLPAKYPAWRFPGLEDRFVVPEHLLTPLLWQELVWT